MVHSSYAETGGAVGNPTLPRPSPVRYLKFSLILSDNLPDSYGSLFIYTLALHRGNTLCSCDVRASAKVRKTSGFPDPRARSHGTYPSDTCKHARPSLFHAHFCLREHYSIFFLEIPQSFFQKLSRYARLIIHFFFRKIISEITSRRISSEVSSAYTPTMPHCNR